jgi:ACT domain-containing protein
MSRIITHAEIVRIPDGGVFHLEQGAELTPLAIERAAARGITIHRGAPPPPDPSELAEAARLVLSRLPDGQKSPEAVERVIAEVVAAYGQGGAPAEGPGLPPSADYCTAYLSAERRRDRRRAVLTASGRNQKGIVARLTAVIADFGGDILDISQTLVGEYFTMLLIVDIGEVGATFEQFKDALVRTAAECGVQAILMHEDIVSSLHRV